MPERFLDVSHEALIRGWPRLRGWLDEDRAGLRLQRRITETAEEWQRSNRDDDLLYRGARLIQAQEWRARHEVELNPLEREFLDASIALKQRLEEHEREQQQRELEAAQKLAEAERRRAEEQKEQRWKSIRLVIILLIAGIFLWRGGDDFERWSETIRYKRDVKASAPAAESSRLTQGPQETLEVVCDLRGVYGKNSDLGCCQVGARPACLLGPYLFGYLVLASFGKWVFLRFAVALSSAQEQKLAEEAQALRDAVATLQTTYGSFWRRLGAHGLALGVFIVGLVTFLLGVGGSPVLANHSPGFKHTLACC